MDAMPFIEGPERRRVGACYSAVAIVLLSLSCSLLPGTAETPTSPPAIPPDEAPQPTTEVTPVPDVTEAVSPTGLEVTCANVHFWLAPSLASGVSCETVPAVPDSGDAAPWDVGPEYVRVTLEGYILAATFHDPRIYVYPAPEYAAMSEPAGQVIARLQALLDTQPQVFEEGIPFLPPFNAAQLLRTQVRYADFQNGAGVRFLTLYGQAYRVINNNELFYTFQGLTQDGGSYVAVVLPVSHPSLPADGEIPPEEFDSFAEGFEAYVGTTEHALEAEAPESFTPDLAMLDALIQYLEVQ
jgi:hypothetical protein